MTTTTVTDVIAKMRDVIEALTPAVEPIDRPFTNYSRANPPLKEWALNAGGNGTLRLFAVRRSGGPRQTVGLQHPDATLVRQPIGVRIAYPVNPELWGLTSLDDLEALIDGDVQQIRNALYSVSALTSSAHDATYVNDTELDRNSGVVWFQDLACEAVFYTPQLP